MSAGHGVCYFVRCFSVFSAPQAQDPEVLVTEPHWLLLGVAVKVFSRLPAGGQGRLHLVSSASFFLGGTSRANRDYQLAGKFGGFCL